MAKTFLLLVMIFVSIHSTCQIIDIDGRKYGTIKIGSQTWTSENINREEYNNGDKIIEAKSIKEWDYSMR